MGLRPKGEGGGGILEGRRCRVQGLGGMRIPLYRYGQRFGDSESPDESLGEVLGNREDL